jgi:hypothetical protein
MNDALSSISSAMSSRFSGILRQQSKTDDTTTSNIRVLVRVRPLNQNEISGNQGENGHINVVFMDPSGTEMAVQFGSAKKRYTFDSVHGPHSTQKDVFNSVKDIVDAVASGYNGTIMAYGQTSSGKTYTVFGNSEGYVEFSETEEKFSSNCFSISTCSVHVGKMHLNPLLLCLKLSGNSLNSLIRRFKP